MSRIASRRVRKLQFEELEQRLAPDALLAGAALVSAAIAGGGRNRLDVA